MILPHLLFGHFVGDYLLQTTWLVVRKSQAWDGLVLHSGIVTLMTVFALAPYLDALWAPLLLLFVVHTAQDWSKVWLGQSTNWHLSWGYFADQGLHYLLILGIALYAQRFDLAVSPFEIMLFSIGTVLIVVTRFYEVSWWSNWFNMIAYMNRWQGWSYLERVAMTLLAMLGAVPAVLAISCALPRLLWSWQSGKPLWAQRYGLLEWALGIALSLGLGYGVLHQIAHYYNLF